MTVLMYLIGLILASYIFVSILLMAFRNIGIIMIFLIVLGCFGIEYLGTHHLPSYDEVMDLNKK